MYCLFTLAELFYVGFAGLPQATMLPLLWCAFVIFVQYTCLPPPQFSAKQGLNKPLHLPNH